MEKPTAQSYYRRFSEEKSIAVEWKLARAKVRNMRVSYNKAKYWESSTGAGSMDGETVKDTLLKMCRYYFELEDIFKHKDVYEAAIQDSLDIEYHTLSNSSEIDYEDTTITSESTTVDIEVLPSTSRKGIYSRTAVSDIMQIQSEMVMLKRQKIDQDLDIKNRELDIKEREVAVKEKEIELKEKEIYSEEKLKILELEMKEGVAIEELKLKYKK